MDPQIEHIRKLSKEILKGSGFPTAEIYLLKDTGKKPTPDTINRIFGVPVGIDDKSWPRYNEMTDLKIKEWDGDTRMDHIFTLDLRGLNIYNPENASALAFFISDCKMNNAYAPFENEVKIIFLMENDLKKGEYTGKFPKKNPKDSRSFEIIPIHVPREVFSYDANMEEKQGDKWKLMGELQSALHNWPARVGGDPIWVQDFDWDPTLDYLLVQFHERFVDIWCGDNGVMYLIATTRYATSDLATKEYIMTGFWQCT